VRSGAPDERRAALAFLPDGDLNAYLRAVRLERSHRER